MKQPNLLPLLLEGEDCYQLTEPWSTMAGRWIVRVPSGFITDGASVPRLLWWLYPPDGLHRAAAVAHDWLYARMGAMDTGELLTRRQCDWIFREVLLLSGVSQRKARVMWLGVRLGGWLPWGGSLGARVEPLRYAVS